MFKSCVSNIVDSTRKEVLSIVGSAVNREGRVLEYDNTAPHSGSTFYFERQKHARETCPIVVEFFREKGAFVTRPCVERRLFQLAEKGHIMGVGVYATVMKRFASLRRVDDAEYFYQIALKVHPSSENLDCTMASIYARLGDTTRVLQIFRSLAVKTDHISDRPLEVAMLLSVFHGWMRFCLSCLRLMDRPTERQIGYAVASGDVAKGYLLLSAPFFGGDRFVEYFKLCKAERDVVGVRRGLDVLVREIEAGCASRGVLQKVMCLAVTTPGRAGKVVGLLEMACEVLLQVAEVALGVAVMECCASLGRPALPLAQALYTFLEEGGVIKDDVTGRLPALLIQIYGVESFHKVQLIFDSFIGVPPPAVRAAFREVQRNKLEIQARDWF